MNLRKRCECCGELKLTIKFPFITGGSHNIDKPRQSICKRCIAITRRKEWYKKNLEKARAYQRAYYRARLSKSSEKGEPFRDHRKRQDVAENA